MEIFGFFNVYTYQQLMVDQYDSLTERTRNCFRKCIFNMYLEFKKNLIRSGSLKQWELEFQSTERTQTSTWKLFKKTKLRAPTRTGAIWSARSQELKNYFCLLVRFDLAVSFIANRTIDRWNEWNEIQLSL